MSSKLEPSKQPPFVAGDVIDCLQDSPEVDGMTICVAGMVYDVESCVFENGEWLVIITGEKHRARDFVRLDSNES